MLLRIGSHGYLPKSFWSSGEIALKGITLVKRSVCVYTRSVCLYAHKHVYIHILIKLDIIQIKFSLTLLTVSFFQYLTIKKMAAARCALYTFTDCTSQSRVIPSQNCHFLLSYTPALQIHPTTFLLCPSIMPFFGHLQLTAQTRPVMWTDPRNSRHTHQVQGGRPSVCSSRCVALSLPYLSVCQLPGALLSAVEWSELGTCPVYVLFL